MDLTGRILLITFAIGLNPILPIAAAAEANWQKFVVPKSGASVEIPMTVFREAARLPDGDDLGRRFYTEDGRADLTVQSFPNSENDSTATFLAKKRPPVNIFYKRVTAKFFVVSSFKKERIWYNRCNRSKDYMNCVLINYPAAEKRQWDKVVTRISTTLSN
jgi:hypothetical protein